MQNSKNKAIATLVIILLTSSILTLLNNSANAASTDPISGDLPSGATASVTIDTTAHLSFRPNPIGVNQALLVNLWTTPATHASRYHPSYVITITKPDGTQDVVDLPSYKADATAWFEIIPDQIGTWTLKFDFPGTYFPEATVTGGFMEPTQVTLNSAYYNPSSSPILNLTVQEDMIASWQTEMPTDYWTRPAHVENRDWWTILGNYPATGYVGGGAVWDELYPDTSPVWNARHKFIPWVQAPNTAHIVWKRQGNIAGLIGGQAGQYGNTGSPPAPSVVYAGRAYDTYEKPGTGQTYWRCYDLRTGEVYWEKVVQSTTTLMWGFWPMTTSIAPNLIEYTAPSTSEMTQGESSGTWSASLMYIGGGRLYKWNPWTGALTVNVSIAPLDSGTFYKQSSASNTDPCVLSVYNAGNATNPNYRLINWTTRGSTSTFASRIHSNTSYAMSSLPSLIDFENCLGASVSGITQAGAYVGETLTGYDLMTGQVLWTKNISEPMYSSICDLVDHGKLATLSAHGYYVAFDLRTGAQVWKGEQMDYPWGSASFGAYSAISAYGMIIRESMDGIYAFDWDTGKKVWKYEAPSNPFESPYTGENGTSVYAFYSFGVGGQVADGKFYTWTYEHTESWPVTRGWSLHCINVTDGKGLWNITGCMTPGAIADGYMTAGNTYDGYMYVFGKGKSTTSLEAPSVAINQGQSVVLSGQVLDQSSAQPNTPCVSAASMGEWMSYLHMQMPIPDNVIGVPVSLDTIDPNGNYIHIADVTTDMSGTYSVMWEPEIPGKYIVTATFMGDDSYGSSYAEAAVGVVEAIESAEPTATSSITMPPFETYFIGTAAVIVIAIAVATFLLLRRRP